MSERLLERINGHGGRAYPEECCGLLLGADREGERVVQDVLEIQNSFEEGIGPLSLRRRRFLVTPEQYRLAERSAADRNMSLLGFYHSHPDHPALPSAFDTEHALPWFTYLIVAVARGRPGDLTVWRLRDDRREFERSILETEAGTGEKVSLQRAPAASAGRAPGD